MSTFGLIGLVIAFAGVVVSVVCLLAGRILKKAGKTGAARPLRGAVAWHPSSLPSP